MSPTDQASIRPEQLRSIAVDVVEMAAALVRNSVDRGSIGTKSSVTDIVTPTDLAAEAAIVAAVTGRVPGSRVLAEEGGHTSAGAGPHGDVEWIVDPIDGTVNFAYRIPVTAVSVAAAMSGRIVAGAVADVDRAEIFSAHLGGGATLADHEIGVGDCTELGLALVTTGFAYDAEQRRRHGRTIAELLGAVRDVRAFGSAALHLCWVADGRVDAYLERDIKPWDYAAGSLIAAEAGAAVELPCVENDGLVLAANPQLQRVLRPLLT